MENLSPGHSISGPAVIIDKLGTIIVEPGCTAEMTAQGDLQILIQTLQTSEVGLELDAGKIRNSKTQKSFLIQNSIDFINFSSSTLYIFSSFHEYRRANGKV